MSSPIAGLFTSNLPPANNGRKRFTPDESAEFERLHNVMWDLLSQATPAAEATSGYQVRQMADYRFWDRYVRSVPFSWLGARALSEEEVAKLDDAIFQRDAFMSRLTGGR